MSLFKIFVSHAEADQHLAEAVVEALRGAFPDQVDLYLAKQKLRAGDVWKEELRKQLASSDAIISIVTPSSIEKPWLYIEWAPFWVREKNWYVLYAKEIDQGSILSPMSERQSAQIEDRSHMERFATKISNDAGLRDWMLPERWSEDLVMAARKAMQLDVEGSFERYQDESVELPREPTSRRKILEHFYERGAIEQFRSIYRRVDDDALKADVAIWVAKRGDLALVATVCENIRGAEHLCRIASRLIQDGYANTGELREILKSIENAAELRKLAVETLDRGEGSSDVFRYMVHIIQNMAELRKVAIRMVERGEHNRPVFGEIIERIRARHMPSLHHVASQFVIGGVYTHNEFTLLLDILAVEKLKDAISVLEELKQRAPDALPPLKERYEKKLGADHPVVVWLANAIDPRPPS